MNEIVARISHACQHNQSHRCSPFQMAVSSCYRSRTGAKKDSRWHVSHIDRDMSMATPYFKGFCRKGRRAFAQQELTILIIILKGFPGTQLIYRASGLRPGYWQNFCFLFWFDFDFMPPTAACRCLKVAPADILLISLDFIILIPLCLVCLCPRWAARIYFVVKSTVRRNHKERGQFGIGHKSSMSSNPSPNPSSSPSPSCPSCDCSWLIAWRSGDSTETALIRRGYGLPDGRSAGISSGDPKGNTTYYVVVAKRIPRKRKEIILKDINLLANTWQGQG